MLFGFRGVRMFQVLMALIALATGVGAAVAAKGYADDGPLVLIVSAIALGLIFLWSFAIALRVPTSFLAVSEQRTRIRFPGFVDTVVDNRNILGAELVHWSILGGIGVRTTFRGRVALVTVWGPAVELTFRDPVRIWLIPRLLPLRARKLTLSLRNPAKAVERFGPPSAPSPAAPAARKMKNRGPRTR